jgi:hypothetical protein
MSQVMWALAYMCEGTAEVWRENIVEDLNTNHNYFPNMHVFYEQIREDFSDRNQRATRINKLRTLVQGTSKAEEYVHKFCRAALRTDYTDTPLIEEFKRLNAPIRRKLVKSENPPTTLQEWFTRAITIDRNYQQNLAKEAIFKSRR